MYNYMRVLVRLLLVSKLVTVVLLLLLLHLHLVLILLICLGNLDDLSFLLLTTTVRVGSFMILNLLLVRLQWLAKTSCHWLGLLVRHVLTKGVLLVKIVVLLVLHLLAIIVLIFMTFIIFVFLYFHFSHISNILSKKEFINLKNSN